MPQLHAIRTDGDVAADDCRLRRAINAVLGHMDNRIVLDVGVAANLDAVHVT